MKQTALAFLLLVVTPVCQGPAVAADIVYDAEFARMQKHFGEQWKADDSEVATKLTALEQKFGRKPNIVFILADDVGYTELGSYGGGKVRGAPTPNLDKMAAQGMRFLSFYSEVECSPSRGAVMTGRHPIRNGLYNITLPGEVGGGLHGDEVTIAELLSGVGYYTGFFGKWHMGGEDEHHPTSQGFDEAEWSEGNPPWWVNNADAKASDDIGGFTNRVLMNSPGPEGFPYDTGGVMRGRKGEEPELVYTYSMEKYNTYDSEVADDVIEFIERRAKTEQPFYVAFWGKANHFWGAHPDFRDTPAQTNTSSQMVEHDYNTGACSRRSEDLGIAENTLVVWSSDNGPMYTAHPHGGYSLLPGGKGETREGGIRVPAIAWWPGMIEPGQEPIDFVQITDWFTTFASIGGALDAIPRDRVIDGVDQSGLLLLGEGKEPSRLRLPLQPGQARSRSQGSGQAESQAAESRLPLFRGLQHLPRPRGALPERAPERLLGRPRSDQDGPGAHAPDPEVPTPRAEELLPGLRSLLRPGAVTRLHAQQASGLVSCHGSNFCNHRSGRSRRAFSRLHDRTPRRNAWPGCQSDRRCARCGGSTDPRF